MAILNPRTVRLLGFVDRDACARLDTLLALISGPHLHWRHGPGVSALCQNEPMTEAGQRGRKALLEGLQIVHRRLECACTQGPFLPVDPGEACCPAAQLEGLLEGNWVRLAASLAAHGACHQWDVILKWQAETLLARQRPALARFAASGDKAGLAAAISSLLRAERARRVSVVSAALTPATLAQVPMETLLNDTEFATTVLVPHGGEQAIEAALLTIPQDDVADVIVDLRGPMPPVSFYRVRVCRVEQGETVRSWRLLGLPEQADAALLHQHWRIRVAASHPDRNQNNPTAAAAFADLSHAMQTLRPQLGVCPTTLRSLLRTAGYRFDIPEVEPTILPDVEIAA